MFGNKRENTLEKLNLKYKLKIGKIQNLKNTT